jgi:hypothetical protein
MLLVLLPFLCAALSSAELTTLLKGRNLTGLEERLSNVERRLDTTERVLGQLLTGRDNADLSALNVLALRSGKTKVLIIDFDGGIFLPST